tara:strand:- start:10952 stop:11929 length:978 start_codon:yes stop_codon:yes gene_type:complete
MNNNKILAVYNTCGINGDNTDWYISSLKSMLAQNLDNCRVVLSSCKNSTDCIKKIYQEFGNKISYSLTPELHTVNITFNKAVQESVKKFGEFDGYMYVDSGCTFDDQNDIFSLSHKTLVENNYGIVVVQTDTDECLENLGYPYLYESKHIQVTGEHLVVPIGTSVNQHTAVFSNQIFKKYKKLYPDVFAAFCSESVLNYIAASVGKRWAIMADYQVRHLKAVDGPSSGFTHRVESKNKSGELVKNNSWNNLLYGRDAVDFVNNKLAADAGLGYEECNKIMPHNPDAYDEEGLCKNIDNLQSVIKKYLFLSNKELNYDTIKCKFIP